MAKVKWIGITGSIGTGKSTVSQILREAHYEVIDADKIAQQQLMKTSSGYQKVVNLFGSEILNTNNEIDRKKLAEKVFKNKQLLSDLESIIHPLVQIEVERLKKIFENRGDVAAFYDVPLLFEKNLQNKFDAVLLVATDPQVQLERIKKRSGWTDEEINKRLNNQISLAEKIKKSQYIIDNNHDLERLKKNTLDMVQKILKTP